MTTTETYGPYGGRYVPETLIPALDELTAAWAEALADPAYLAEVEHLGRTYTGRPSPITLAPRFAPNKRLYLKREDLNHTGAHKINNALGQVVLAQRLGKTRIIAETGAGQHGVATATACARFGLECVVFMGSEDMRRQAPNVERMHLMGATVVPVEFGTRTLKEATSEAIRDWITNVETTHYVIGSCVGPAPYPEIVRELQAVIGREAREQLLEAEGTLPEAVVACVGGGSNAIGMFAGFIDDDFSPRLREIEVPTLIVWGMKDIAFREKELKRWEGAFPEARKIRLRSVGHFVQEEAPDELVAAVIPFLKEPVSA